MIVNNICACLRILRYLPSGKNRFEILFEVFVDGIDLFNDECHLVFQLVDLAFHLFEQATAAFGGDAQEPDVVFVSLKFVLHPFVHTHQFLPFAV